MPVKNEVGNVYGRLTVIERGPNKKDGTARWYCKCSCGNPELVLVMGSSLRNGKTKSCGCLHKETARLQGLANAKQNSYDLSGEYGIGYTTKNEPFYFDKEDYEKIKDYCWYKDTQGYLCCKRDKMYLLHRVIMDAQYKEEVDHINHNTIDNRKENLRICSSSQNHMNRGASSISASGIRGVYWYNNLKKWSAEIVVDGQKIILGQYKNIEDAIKARKEAEIKYFKEYRYIERGHETYDEKY